MVALFSKNNIITLLFFGLAGAIWGGWDLYGSDPPATYPLTIIGAVSLGLFVGIGLALPTIRDIRRTLKIVVLGSIGTILGFAIAWLGSYNLLIVGTYIFVIFPSDFIDLIKLEPTLKISAYWLNFAVAGVFIGLFFAFALKVKIWSVAWRSAVGFGLAALIAPIVGNLVGNLFNSVLLSYLITFILISKILGLMTLWGAQKQRDAKNPS